MGREGEEGGREGGREWRKEERKASILNSPLPFLLPFPSSPPSLPPPLPQKVCSSPAAVSKPGVGLQQRAAYVFGERYICDMHTYVHPGKRVTSVLLHEEWMYARGKAEGNIPL